MGHKHGRTSIFGSKWKGDRVQGLLTKEGAVMFERCRTRLAHLVGREAATVSDGDTIEYAVRGDTQTRAYLKAQR